MTVSYSELLSAAVAGSLLFGVNDFLKRAAGVPSDGAEETVRYTGSTVPSYHLNVKIKKLSEQQN
jgi:hypothetical protein